MPSKAHLNVDLIPGKFLWASAIRSPLLVAVVSYVLGTGGVASVISERSLVTPMDWGPFTLLEWKYQSRQNLVTWRTLWLCLKMHKLSLNIKSTKNGQFTWKTLNWTILSKVDLVHKTHRLGRSWKIVIEQLHAIRKHNLNTHLILVVLSASQKVISCALRGWYMNSITHTEKRGKKA